MSTPRRVTIDVPSVPYPGGRSDAYFLRRVAENITAGYAVGGSNVTATVARLLNTVADELDHQDATAAADALGVAPESTEDLAHVEALARQRRQLAQKHGDDHRQASWFAVRLAVEDTDGTGRPGTDAEVLAAVRALAQDDAAEDARVVVEIGRLLEERDQ